LVSDTTSGTCCSKIAEAEAAVSVNQKKWLVMQPVVLSAASTATFWARGLGHFVVVV
jgi:hypothetical protein